MSTAVEKWQVQAVANLICLNTSLTDIATQLSMPFTLVKRINLMKETQDLVVSRGEEIAFAAKSWIRRDMARLSKKAMRVIEDELDRGNLESAKVLLKVLGALEPEPIQAQATQINLVVPGYEKKELEIKPSSV